MNRLQSWRVSVRGIARASVLCALLVLAALAGDHIQQARAVKAQCSTYNCKDGLKQSGNCIAYAGMNCNFSQSAGNVPFCDTFYNSSCTLHQPTIVNECDG